MPTNKVAEGYFAGSPILVHDGPTVSLVDFEAYIKQFDPCSILLAVNYASNLIEESTQKGVILDSKPIFYPALAYIILKALEQINLSVRAVTLTELAELCSMYIGLDNTDKNLDFDGDQSASIAQVMRMGSQFDFQTHYFNSLPRTIILYADLWGQVDHTFDIQAAFKNICGLGVEEMITFAVLFFGAATSSPSFHRQKYTGFTGAANFLKWISIDFAEFRALGAEFKKRTPDPNLDRYRLNPIHLRPLVELPSPALKAQELVAPIPRLIIDKCTKGIYHELGKPYEKQKANPFRIAFGDVFEAYVGRLLENCLTKVETVSGNEFRYLISKKEGARPDWILRERDRLILLEVKQSALYLSSRLTGEESSIRHDLSQTIHEAVTQLYEFESNIGTVPELSALRGVNQIDRIILCHDSVPFSNSLIKDHLDAIGDQATLPIRDYYCHIMTIEELELILGVPNIDLFQFLYEKRRVPHNTLMDFKNFTWHQNPTAEIANPYLTSRYQRFLEDIMKEERLSALQRPQGGIVF